MKAYIEKACFIVGGMLIVASLVLTLYNIWDSRRAAEESQNILTRIEEIRKEEEEEEMREAARKENASEKESESETENLVPLYKRYPEMAMPTYEIDGYRYIGTIEFPDLKLTLPVMEEWDYDRLRIAPCRYHGSAYTNDLVIAGHNYAAHFSPVKTLPIGSKVIFTDADNHRFEYVIAWTEILEPTQVDELISEEEDNTWDLTVFTCTLGGGTRYTARCILQ